MIKVFPCALVGVIALTTLSHAQSVFDPQDHCNQAMGFMDEAQQKHMEDYILFFAMGRLNRTIPNTPEIRDQLVTSVLQVCFELQDATFTEASVEFMDRIEKREAGN